MDLLNKTQAPLAVPLARGKKLRLGPGRTGQISPKALDHPPLKKMIEEGLVEVVGGGRGRSGGSKGDSRGLGPSTSHGSGGAMRHTGDR